MRLSDIPQFSNFRLYKYRPWNLYSESVLIENKIYFASPSDVNDPFDCRFPELVKPSDDQLMAYLKIQYLNLRDPWRDKSRVHGGILLLDSHIDAEINNKGSSSWPTIIKHAKETIMEKSSFCSLSEVNDSSLMYSHYAAGHTGICFEFQYTLEFAFGHVEAVTYKEHFPPLDLFNDEECDDECLVGAIIYQKHVDWAYEKEWRIFNLRKPRGVYTFDHRCLSGIIFGCKMPEKDRERASVLALNREQTPAIYEAIMKPDGYGLEIRDWT